MYHSSRSATECYFDCPRKRYLRYHCLGYGIDPISKSVPLTTGSAVHAGIEIILKSIQKNLYQGEGDNSRIINYAIYVAHKAYDTLVEGEGFSINEGFNDGGYLYQEQKSLTEALVRAYSIIEAPYIYQNYQVLSVEKDIPLSLLPFNELDYPVKADAILLSKSDNRIYVYSLKTTKIWNERTQLSYRIDLQGITELAGVRQALKGTKYEPLIGGVAFCFLVKGNFAFKEGRWETDSPLIRGWKYQGPNLATYAHSFWFPNPSNQSGKGRLPNSYTPFKVWESYPGGIKEWIGDLGAGEIQPDCPNPLIESVRSPLPSYRDDHDLDITLQEIAQAEKRIIIGLEQLKNKTPYTNTKELMSSYFPRNRRSCYWPTQCEYIPICHQGITNVLESGYKLRIPHHEAERKEFYQIQEAKEATK